MLGTAFRLPHQPVSVLPDVVPAEVSWSSPHPSVSHLGKRLLDTIGALVGLTVLAIAIVPIAIAIQLDNPGPIFYSQIRYGYQGKAFRLWKFRSMVANADQIKHLVKNEAQGLIFKSQDDPRVTRVGKFLRRSSLDELPQFWNIFRGDMSLVGTRPPVRDEVIKYRPHHWKRLEVRPGLTGEWQANGRSSISDFEDIVKMDILYQQRWSMAYDLRLLFKTLWVVIASRGAY